MLQQAIRFTQDNLSDIADTLIEYTPETLENDYAYLLSNNFKYVLVREEVYPGEFLLSHVVTESMFYANATTTDPLNDKNFVQVVQL